MISIPFRLCFMVRVIILTCVIPCIIITLTAKRRQKRMVIILCVYVFAKFSETYEHGGSNCYWQTSNYTRIKNNIFLKQRLKCNTYCVDKEETKIIILKSFSYKVISTDMLVYIYIYKLYIYIYNYNYYNNYYYKN